MRLFPFPTCRDVLDRLGDEWDGTLPPGTSLGFRLHLWFCRSCRRYRSSYRTTAMLIAAVKTEADFAPAPPLNEAQVRHILRRVQERPSDSKPGEDSPPASS